MNILSLSANSVVQSLFGIAMELLIIANLAIKITQQWEQKRKKTSKNAQGLRHVFWKFSILQMAMSFLLDVAYAERNWINQISDMYFLNLFLLKHIYI